MAALRPKYQVTTGRIMIGTLRPQTWRMSGWLWIGHHTCRCESIRGSSMIDSAPPNMHTNGMSVFPRRLTTMAYQNEPRQTSTWAAANAYSAVVLHTCICHGGSGARRGGPGGGGSGGSDLSANNWLASIDPSSLQAVRDPGGTSRGE